MDIKYLIIVAALINFLLGLVVFRKPKKSRADISFIIFIWFTTVWAAAFFFYEHPFFLNSLIWIKIVYFLVFGIVGSLFYFSFVFPSGEQKPPKIVLIIYSIIAFPFIWTLFFTDLFVVQVIQESWGYQTVIGPIYIPLTFYFIPVIIWCFSNFFKNYRRAKGIHKIQLRYMFVGLGLFVGPTLVVDAFIPLLTGQSRCFWLSPVFSFFFIGCTAYAILRYRLMDISLVVRTGLVYLLSTVILIAGVLGAIYFFSSLVGYTPNIKLVMIGSLAMSVLLLIFIPLKDFLLKIANKYFFKTVYTTQETLKSIREKAATIIELDKLIKEIVDTIKKAFGLSSIAFLLKEKEVFIVEENIGFEVEDIFALTKEEFLFTSLEEKRKALILEEIEGKPENLKEKMEEMEVFFNPPSIF